MRFIDQEQELRRELPKVFGNADYREYAGQLDEIDRMLILSGIETRFVEVRLATWEQSGRRVGIKARVRYQKMCVEALRMGIARQLTEREYRKFAMRLAESSVLQRFCRVGGLEGVTIPSKSTLERYDKLAPECEIRELVSVLIRMSGGADHARLGLESEVGVDVLLVDSTCLKANIHFPTDWVLLRDGVRTLMKAVKLIRREGLKHRMDEPETFLREINRLSIEMTQGRRAIDSVKRRKQVLRKMKRLVKVVRHHGERYVFLLKMDWAQTDWTEAQARQVWRRMESVLAQLPEAVRQAHERLIGRRLVPNEEKLLSLYEPDVRVIVRGKAGADVEFGNTLYVGEQQDGLIVDWKLLREQSRGDSPLLEESLDRIHADFGRHPSAVGADRGFDRPATRRKLRKHGIMNGICPRSVTALQDRMQDEGFVDIQRRRAQTEGRIGILKNNFLGPVLRNKGFESREREVAWAVLAHNLWVLARMLRAQEKDRKKAA
jgi:IS5 family transposase